MTQSQLPFPSDPDPSPQPVVPMPHERYLMRAALVPLDIYQMAYVHYGRVQKRKLHDLELMLAGMVDKGFIYLKRGMYMTSEKGISLLPESERIAAPEFFSIPADPFNSKNDRRQGSGRGRRRAARERRY